MLNTASLEGREMYLKEEAWQDTALREKFTL